MTWPAIEATGTWNVRGRTCMVTGASGGMGKELAAGLARRGASVVMVCRDGDKGRAARDAIVRATGNSAVELLLADLSDQAAIHGIVAEFLSRHDHLHVLINNAGAHVMNRQLNVDGVEMNLAVNHLSAFVLTNLLVPTLTSSAPARIVNVASRSMTRSIDLDNLNWEHDFAPWPAYGQAKLAMVLCSYRLARQLAGTGVVVNAVHPGLTATDIVDDIASPRLRPILPIVKAFLLSPERGAQAALRFALSADWTGVTGAYFERGRRRRSADVSYDLDFQERTWQASNDLVGAGQAGERFLGRSEK
jgi:NAD(P)-dependent dehydrogenase (short-subunit alcohol dehydrogenase family)